MSPCTTQENKRFLWSSRGFSIITCLKWSVTLRLKHYGITLGLHFDHLLGEHINLLQQLQLSSSASSSLPHGSVIVVQLVGVISEGVSVLLMPHGILVHGSVGLGGGVVRRRDAVTGLTAVVAVPVIHSTVWVLVCSRERSKRWDHGRGWDTKIVWCKKNNIHPTELMLLIRFIARIYK